MMNEEQIGQALFQLALNEVQRSNYIYAQSVSQLPLPLEIKQANAVANGWGYFCALSIVSGYNTSMKVFGKDGARKWLTEMAQYLSQFAHNEGHRIKVNLTVAE
jgi:hypothetical protein